MTSNPFQPPQAVLGDSLPTSVEVPEAIAKKIKNCWMAGVVSIAITLIFALLAMSGSVNPLQIDAWIFVDLGFMAVFTFGVYKKSRTCAILLLGLFVMNKALMWTQSGQTSGLPLALVFLWLYGQGVVGTFQYHKLLSSRSADV